MRDFSEWELRRLQLELQRVEEDYTELNNFFGSEAFNFTEELSQQAATEMMLEDASFVDDDDQSDGLLMSIDGVDDRSNMQILHEEKFIII